MSKRKENGASVAAGGRHALGAKQEVVEMEIGPGKRYDPSRDVIVFMPGMLAGIARTIHERAWPVLKEIARDEERYNRVYEAMAALIQVLSVSHKEDYDEVVKNWIERSDPESVDLVLKVFGRAVLQFYIEAVRNRQRPEGERWPCGAERLFAQLARDFDVEPIGEAKEEGR